MSPVVKLNEHLDTILLKEILVAIESFEGEDHSLERQVCVELTFQRDSWWGILCVWKEVHAEKEKGKKVEQLKVDSIVLTPNQCARFRDTLDHFMDNSRKPLLFELALWGSQTHRVLPLLVILI